MMIRWVLALVVLPLLLFSTEQKFPILDFEEYLHVETKEKFTQEVYSALHEFGFFAMRNVKIDPEKIENAYAEMAEYFAQSSEEKNIWYLPKHYGLRGFTPGERPKGKEEKDFKEFFTIGPISSSARGQYSDVLDNIWPYTKSFQKRLTKFYLILDWYKTVMERAIAEAIGSGAHFFTERTHLGDTLLRLTHYPKDLPEGRWWAAEHTDMCLFSLFPICPGKAMELLLPSGEWVQADLPEEMVIICAGDLLQNITNGELKSALYRMNGEGTEKELLTIAMHVNPRSTDNMSPLSLCVERTGGKPLFPPGTKGFFLNERLVDLDLDDDKKLKEVAENGLLEHLIPMGRASPRVLQKLKDAGLANAKVLAELEKMK